MELFYTGKEDKKEKIPFLLDKNMEYVDAPNQWLRYISLVKGRTRSQGTWKTYGSNLYDYFSWLEVNKKGWNAVIQNDLAEYRNYLIDNPTARGTKISPKTVNLRLTIISEFYKWALRNKYIKELPFEYCDLRAPRSGGFLKHLDSSGGTKLTNTLRLKDYKEAPKYIPEREIKRLLKTLTSKRDKLIVLVFLETGMRLSELAGLRLTQIPSINVLEDDNTFQELIIIGKGNKKRKVYLSSFLCRQIEHYIQFDRVKLERLPKKVGRTSDALWLNRSGAPLSAVGIYANIKNAAKKINLAHIHPHMFRHTFGYKFYKMTKNLKYLKDLLGHSLITVTDIYTHIDPEDRIVFVEKYLESLQNLYSEALK